VPACTISTTPRRNVRWSSLGSAGAEDEVDRAGERGRRDARERDEGEAAASRRALNDTPDPICDWSADRHKRCGEERTAESERPVPDDRRRDAETEAGKRPPAPAYRGRTAKSDDRGRDDERHEVGRPSQKEPETQNKKWTRVEAAQEAEREARAERHERDEARAEPGDVVREGDPRGVLERGLGREDGNRGDEARDLGTDVVHEGPGTRSIDLMDRGELRRTLIGWSGQYRRIRDDDPA